MRGGGARYSVARVTQAAAGAAVPATHPRACESDSNVKGRGEGGGAPVFNAQDNKAARGKLAGYVRVAEGGVSEGLGLVMVE